MVVLFVTLVTATTILYFAKNTVDTAQRGIEDLRIKEPDVIVDMEGDRVGSAEIVYLAQSCYKSNTGQVLSRKLCHVVHGDIQTSSTAVVNELTSLAIPHSVHSFSPGVSSIWIYYHPQPEGTDAVEVFVSGPTAGPAPTYTCTSLGFRCCDSCQSGAQPSYDSDCPGQVCCTVCAGAGPGETLTIVPSNYNPSVGDQLNVDIVVNNINDLAGVQLDLDFDSSKLQYVGKTDGSFLGSCPVDPVVVGNSLTNIACVSLTGGKTGTGTIITLTFQVIGGAGQQVIFSISNQLLSDSGMVEIPATTGTATIQIAGGAGPSCSDGIQNQGETGIDCGGPCPPCSPAPSCSDGIQNQGETGVDCGGPCPPCAGGGETLTIVPSPSTLSVGATVNVDINVNSITDLAGAQLDLNFDSSRLQYVSKTDGSFLDSCPVAPAAVGSVVTNIACIAFGGGKTGSGPIITLTFTATSSGSAQFSISNPVLLDSTSTVITGVTTGTATIQIS